MQKSKNAFTMIELIFIIVVLGILAAVAIPRFAVTRNDAVIAKGAADVATIRSAIVTERQTRLITGQQAWIPTLSTAGGNLFTGNTTGGVTRTLLTYGIATGGEWDQGLTTAATDTYTFTVGGTSTTFTYTVATGAFTCPAGTGDCDELVN